MQTFAPIISASDDDFDSGGSGLKYRFDKTRLRCRLKLPLWQVLSRVEQDFTTHSDNTDKMHSSKAGTYQWHIFKLIFVVGPNAKRCCAVLFLQSMQ